MSDDTDTGQQARGRHMRIEVFGASEAGLDMAALDAAREFFGADRKLEVIRDYPVQVDRHSEPSERYSAPIWVREVIA